MKTLTFNHKIPMIVEADSWGPNIGVLENFGFKSSQLTDKECIILGVFTEDDLWDRDKPCMHVVYLGKRPQITKTRLYHWINNIE